MKSCSAECEVVTTEQLRLHLQVPTGLSAAESLTGSHWVHASTYSPAVTAPHIEMQQERWSGAQGEANGFALRLQLTCCWFLTSDTTPFSRQSTFGGASKSAYLKPLLLPIPSPVPFNSGLQTHWIQTLPQQRESSTFRWTGCTSDEHQGDTRRMAGRAA